MHIETLHEWHLPPPQAIQLQRDLAPHLRDEPIVLDQVRVIAGVDVSVKNEVSQAAIVVLSYPQMQVLETVRVQRPTTYPYIPGLLTFREGPVLVEAFEQLQHDVDVFIFDGMGRIHPRRMGIAAHLGLWLNKPTIGCGKTHLLGTYDPLPLVRGSMSDLRFHNETLGVVLRTRDKVKPVYISAGHRATLATSIPLILSVTPKYRLPQPVRLAHVAAGNYAD